eukprot:8928854-Prorocentrum_lima.AAC.1
MDFMVQDKLSILSKEMIKGSSHRPYLVHHKLIQGCIKGRHHSHHHHHQGSSSKQDHLLKLNKKLFNSNII